MDDFLRLSADTARFTHGAPRAFSFGDDGRLLWFLRSTGPTDPFEGLWVLDTATGAETLLADPRALAPEPGELPVAERRLRERIRLVAAGIGSYALSGDGRRAVFPLYGRLYAVTLGGAAWARGDPRRRTRPGPASQRRRLAHRVRRGRRPVRRPGRPGQPRRRGPLGRRRVRRRRGTGSHPRPLVVPRRRDPARRPGRRERPAAALVRGPGAPRAARRGLRVPRGGRPQRRRAAVGARAWRRRPRTARLGRRGVPVRLGRGLGVGHRDPADRPGPAPAQRAAARRRPRHRPHPGAVAHHAPPLGGPPAGHPRPAARRADAHRRRHPRRGRARTRRRREAAHR